MTVEAKPKAAAKRSNKRAVETPSATSASPPLPVTNDDPKPTASEAPKTRLRSKSAPAAVTATTATLEGTLLQQAHEALSRASVELLRREPFFGHLLGGMPRHFTTQIPTMAVCLRGDIVQFLVNPSFVVEELTRAEHRTAVVKHEVLHVVFKHLFRLTTKGDPKLWNIAADLVVNQYVAPFDLPDGAVLLSTFPDLELPEGETVEFYYEALRKLRDRAASTVGSEPGEDKPFPQKSAEALERLMSGPSVTDHSRWRSGMETELDGEATGSGVAQAVAEALSHGIDEQLIRAHRRTRATRGTLPQWLEGVVMEALERRKPKVDWRRTLRLFAQSSRRTRIVTTQRRESRRFESIPGVRMYSGLKVKRFQRIAVVIDTSGSVGANELILFFAEIAGIHRQGAEITIVECDASVKRAYDYEGKSPKSVTGGGGTDFEPAMQWLRTERTRRFDACIYLTDGCAPAPATKPPCPLMWVVVGGGTTEHLPFGRAVSIP